jgi:hypothetical protein
MVSKLIFSFSEMYEIAKKSFDVWSESTDCKMIDTVLDIREKDGAYHITTYDGIIMEINSDNELEVFNEITSAINIIEVLNTIFAGLKNEVEKFYQDKEELMKKYEGKTFDDIVKGYRA